MELSEAVSPDAGGKTDKRKSAWLAHRAFLLIKWIVRNASFPGSSSVLSVYAFTYYANVVH